MLIHKTYKTEIERLNIIADMEAKGYSQVSTKGYFVGTGHLLFDDGQPERLSLINLTIEVNKIKAKIADYDDLKARVEKLEKK